MATIRVRAHERRDSRTGGMEHVREHSRHVDGTESVETHETNFENEEQKEEEPEKDETKSQKETIGKRSEKNGN